MSTACCPTDVKPVVNNYQGAGKKVTIQDGSNGPMEMYIVGPSESKVAIINIYDIFGASGHTEQFADHLSSAMGECIICVPNMIPDPWPAENVPPSKDGKFPAGVEPADGIEVLVNWILHHPSCRLDRLETLAAVKGYLISTHGVEKVGLVGMCWGAKVAFSCLNKKADLADAIAACHGSFLNVSDVELLSVPICLLNSKDEPESYAKEIEPILKAKSSTNVFKTFPEMHHGWMGTRGTGAVTDFVSQEIVQGFLEGIADLANFFAEAFKEQKL
jgi:dienelactone hydrolase